MNHMKDSVFTKIIKRELPAEIICEDDMTIVILTLEPHSPGHMLVIPKVQIDRFYDLDEAHYVAVMKKVKEMANLAQVTFRPVRVGLAVVGFEVPHVHIHVIPMNEISDLDHTKAHSASADELKKVANRLRTQLKSGQVG